MEFVTKTDVGRKRTNNEDDYYAKIYEDDVALYIVADGLGGYESGEVASKILTRTMSKYIEEHIKIIKDASDEKIKSILEKALELANEEIYDLEKTDEKYKGMGTTVVTIFKNINKVYYISVGDSRIYYIDKNISKIEQVTVDDTYVNELIRTNVIDPSEAETHPQKHVLTKAVGVFRKLTIKSDTYNKEDGYFLLCTDGITNMIGSEEILNMFRKNKFKNIADKLVLKANENGGTDNITVVVVKL